MVWVRVAFHENDGNHENDENNEDNPDSYKQGVECWIRGNHGNHENDENPTRIQGAKHRFPKPRVFLQTPLVNPLVFTLVDVSAPKKIFSHPPPKIPQFATDTLPAPRPLPLLEPPPGIFNKKPIPPPSRRLRLPLPPPRAEKNKKYPKRPPS